MAKILLALGVLLVAANIGANASKLPSNVKIEVVTPKEMKDILKQYPNAIELSRKVHATHDTKETAPMATPNVLIEYFMGNRVVGDFLVAHDAQGHSWGTPQDIEMTMNYPANGGNGYIVSFIQIHVNQSNRNGRAFIVYGGIGYRYVRLIIEAYSTYVFSYDSNVYGY